VSCAAPSENHMGWCSGVTSTDWPWPVCNLKDSEGTSQLKPKGLTPTPPNIEQKLPSSPPPQPFRGLHTASNKMLDSCPLLELPGTISALVVFVWKSRCTISHHCMYM